MVRGIVLLMSLLTLLLCARVAPAQETIFYKCTDAKGTVSVQNGTPCASGSGS